jgi:hypothetical protein
LSSVSRLSKVKSPLDWERFITQATPTLSSDFSKRATADEMVALQMPLQTSFLDKADALAGRLFTRPDHHELRH